MRAPLFVPMLPWAQLYRPYAGQLDERLVKPYLLRELRENDTYRWRIIDAIKDINLFLDWHLAGKSPVQI